MNDIATISASLATITKALTGLRRRRKVVVEQSLSPKDAILRLLDIIERQDEAIHALTDVTSDISKLVGTSAIVAMRADRVAMAVKDVVEPMTEKAEWARLEVISQIGYGMPNAATR